MLIGRGWRRALTALAAAATLGPLASTVTACSSSNGGEAPGDEDGTKTGCGADCNAACNAALPPGLVGSYTSVASAPDGTLWVAGYNDATVTDGLQFLYGDLVVGKYDRSTQRVGWETVDGLPPPRTDGSCPVNDPKGWRGGEEEPGDDVGRWTSLRISGGGQPMLTYFDATHGALKFASHDGTKWSVHTVARSVLPKSEVGRYAKLLVVDGKPVVAFLGLEPGDKGRTRSRVSLARGKVEVPQGHDDWTFEDIHVDEDGLCRAAFCSGEDVCAPSVDSACVPRAKGCESCGSGSDDKACVLKDDKPTCVDRLTDTAATSYPRAFGAYLSFAQGPRGLNLTLYDRNAGRLIGMSNETGKWDTLILDGDRSPTRGGRTDPGETGVGTSLVVTANGDWHVTYASGFVSALQYLHIPGGLSSTAPRQAPLVVDDGTALAGKPFTDGRHRVGDDSFLSVDDKGGLAIVYQDGTAGSLRLATRAPDAKAPWTLRALDQPGKFGGFFPQLVRAGGGKTEIASWWRSSDPTTRTMSGDVSLVTP